MAEPLTASAWPQPMSLVEARRGTSSHPIERHLQAGAPDRARIAKSLSLESLEALDADIAVSAWRDGARIDGAWRASITQICGVSLDPFQTELEGDFSLTVVPEGSILATPPAGPEVVVDPLADDPPDVLAGDQIDLGGYVVEHLALEIDPFPRKPGAVFKPPSEAPAPSPFAALGALNAQRKNGKA